MSVKKVLLGTAASIFAVSAANAADAIIAPEPENVEYVRVCDTYGAGYFYVPGTETCLRIHGYVRYDVKGGDFAETGSKRGGFDSKGRFALRVSTGSETELGTLKTFAEARLNVDSKASGVKKIYGGTTDYVDPQTGEEVDTGGQSGSAELQFAYIELGGLKVGIDESEFHTFSGYLGDVINDDVVSAGSYRTGKISYTFNAGNGISAVLALEEGGDQIDGVGQLNKAGEFVAAENDYVINDYIPHVVAGVKYTQAWGSIAAVAAYDAVIEEWAAKVRGDVNITNQISAWMQGGYSSDERSAQNYGSWGGDWAVWGGLQYKATQQATFNVQGAYEDWGKTAVSANVAYEVVPGFTITPELSYTKWDRSHPVREAGLVKKDAFQGMVRFERSF